MVILNEILFKKEKLGDKIYLLRHSTQSIFTRSKSFNFWIIPSNLMLNKLIEPRTMYTCMYDIYNLFSAYCIKTFHCNNLIENDWRTKIYLNLWTEIVRYNSVGSVRINNNYDQVINSPKLLYNLKLPPKEVS